MGSLATIQNAAGETEAHGLTLLDIVKHAVRTIIHTLHDTDRLSLVAYSSQARLVFDLMPMTKDGRHQAEMHLHNLRAGNHVFSTRAAAHVIGAMSSDIANQPPHVPTFLTQPFSRNPSQVGRRTSGMGCTLA
jgi:hypothetical protein